MRKHEKRRVQGIKLQQKLAKAKKHVYDAYAKQAGSRPEHELFADSQIIVNVVQSLSLKTLNLVVNHPHRFVFPRKEELQRLAKDEITLRSLQISR